MSEMAEKIRGSTRAINARHAGGFGRAARRLAGWAGHPLGFTGAVALVIVWALLGPAFGFSDTWQLVINTGTTIITFLMVFLIQNTQNRDTQALQIKIDELLRITKGAHYALMDLEELTDREIEHIRGRYLELAEDGRERLRTGRSDTGAPNIDF
jgi:low affinity Fe/Cu permease